MRKIWAVMTMAGALGGCAHTGERIYTVDSHFRVAVGERHGRQIWLYDGSVVFIQDDQHVRLPSFQDTVLVGDKLYLTNQPGSGVAVAIRP